MSRYQNKMFVVGMESARGARFGCTELSSSVVASSELLFSIAYIVCVSRNIKEGKKWGDV